MSNIQSSLKNPWKPWWRRKFWKRDYEQGIDDDGGHLVKPSLVAVVFGGAAVAILINLSRIPVQQVVACISELPGF